MTQIKILRELRGELLEKAVNDFLESLAPTGKVIKIQYQVYINTNAYWTAMVVYEKNE